MWSHGGCQQREADAENCSLQENEKLSTVVPDLVHKPGQREGMYVRALAKIVVKGPCHLPTAREPEVGRRPLAHRVCGLRSSPSAHPD